MSGFFVILCIAILSGCNYAAKEEKILKCSLNPNLYPLCMPRDEFINLTRMIINKDTTGKKNKKIVFQFFYTNGVLTLTTFAGCRNHKDFVQGYTLIPETSCTPAYSIFDNSAVSLGDLEIKGQDSSNVNALLGDTSNANIKFFVFIPKLVTDAANKTTIQYDICIAGKPEEICNATTFLEGESGSTSVSLNPSPPYGGN
jgi:hypothetical protein